MGKPGGGGGTAAPFPVGAGGPEAGAVPANALIIPKRRMNKKKKLFTKTFIAFKNSKLPQKKKSNLI
jgi:hypothetical protein